MRQSQPDFADRSAEAQAEREGLANYVARYTVALVVEDRPELATGVLVSSEGALFVATARHFAKELPIGDVFCIPKPPGPIRVTPRDEALRRFAATQPGERFILHVQDRRLSTDGSDVALLQLRDRPIEFDEMDFYPLERARSAPLPHNRVLVQGWPEDLALRHEDDLAAFPRTVAGTLSTLSDPEYNPDRDLVISYFDPAPIVARGMSGGGIWLRPEHQRLFDPGATILVGIQVAKFPESRAPGQPLLARRIERVKALLGR
jgi:hypothetical protein